MRDSLALAAFSGLCFILAAGFLMEAMQSAASVFTLGGIISLNGAFICSAIEKKS